MNRIIVALALFACAAVAQAAEMTVTWQWPTTLVDGSPQPTAGPGALTSVRIEWGSCAGDDLDEFGTAQGQMVRPYPETSMTVTVGAGIKCVRGFSLNNLNQQSGPSNLGRYFPKPKPVDLTAPVGRDAYELRRKADGDYHFVKVGTVRRTQDCGAVLVDSFGTVENVKLTRALKGGAVVAKCK